MYKILLKRHFLSRMRKLNYRERLVETAVHAQSAAQAARAKKLFRATLNTRA